MGKAHFENKLANVVKIEKRAFSDYFTDLNGEQHKTTPKTQLVFPPIAKCWESFNALYTGIGDEIPEYDPLDQEFDLSLDYKNIFGL